MPEKTRPSSTLDCQEDLINRIKAEIPEGILDRPTDAAGFEEPVAWLGGRELIANLKLIFLHALFGGKLDSRDWMTGVINPVGAKETQLSEDSKADASGELYTRGVEIERDEMLKNEFWFDYIADTGDGQMPTYNIAYLAMKDISVKSTEGEVSLPRGNFLFIGGDTAYHVADYETLAKRFQAPFWWAYQDLVCEGKIPEAEMLERRPLFGIPANHDYYDALDGFNRQFRRPITGEDDKTKREPQLRLPTFERHQEASYVALHLPFDWWLWGLDTEGNEIDFRQQMFFKKLSEDYPPKKLIVATPSPTTVFGKYLDKEESLTKVFEAIGLKRPFLKDEEKEEADKLETGECRLDLSGDIHHYARYWGPDTTLDEKDKPRNNQRGKREENPQYASVVSGGGGAFFDPTNTYFGEVKEQALYPTEHESRRAMSTEILDVSNIRSGGYIHYAGGFVSLVICFAAIILHTRTILFTWIRPLADSVISWAMVPIVISLLLLIPGDLLLEKTVKRINEWIESKEPKGEDTKKRVTSVQRKTAIAQTLVISLFLLVTVLFMGLGIWTFSSYSGLPLFSNSLIVFLATVWAILMAVLYVQYTERLNKQAKKRPIKVWEFLPARAMLISGVVIFCFSLWLFGRSASLPPAYLFADIVFITIICSLGLGVTLLALLVGGARHDWKGKAGYFFIGLWHALLQLAVPLLWTLSVFHLSILTRPQLGMWGVFIFSIVGIAILLGAYSVFRLLGTRFVRGNNRRLLVATWIAYGLLMISLPALYLVLARVPEMEPVLPTWARVVLCISGSLIGALMSCVWFGWYLAVAMIFNGHNNEAGGAARLVGYKQLMRIRLTYNDLTAYVIGFDKARAKGKEVENNLRLIDQFTLTIDG